MPIDRIVGLRDFGVFRDFKWPSDLPGFGRYNLIYGWNGSGKTTLSRLFRDLEAGKPPAMGQATFSIDGHDLKGEDFAQGLHPIRVFNRDFVFDSVFPEGGGDVPPIFVLGKGSVEKQKEADRLRDQLTREEADLAATRSAKQLADRAFDQYCIDRATVIRDTLRSTGSIYNNYNKSDYRDSAQKMAAAGDAATHRLTEAGREKLLAQHRATLKEKVRLPTYQQPELKPLADAVSDLLATTVVSAAIQSLKDDPALSTWVRQGLSLHQERQAVECLFCGQPMPRDRLAALEAHFNTEYEQLMKWLDDKVTEIEAASKSASELVLPNRAELYEDLASEYGTAEAALRQVLDASRRFLDLLAQSLAEKKGRPFQRLTMDVVVPEIDSDALNRLNEVIVKHNRGCEEFQSRVNDARQSLEAGFVAETEEELVRLRDDVGAAGERVANAETRIGELNAKIVELERAIVDHLRPAEELNEDLHDYLGHDELRLEVKDTGYTIARSGAPAHALSEGEITAIALLYFLKSLRDRRFGLEDGVVVLDDPVSSLDANALYLAFGFIRERTMDAGQLFIFTHNFSFFRAVRNWFHNLRGKEKKSGRFYMLECGHDGNTRRSDIRPLDRLLEKYESEYHYLFARIYREANTPGTPALEMNYVLPNMARRLLEAFLAFRQPQVSGELWQKMNRVQFDEAKKLRIYRFLQVYSHSGAIGEPEHDPSLLREGQAVLKDLLDLVNSEDPAHFAAMEELVGQCADEGSGE